MLIFRVDKVAFYEWNKMKVEMDKETFPDCI